MITLGLSGHFGTDDADLAPGMPRNYSHDSAACLIVDGQLVAAAEQERFNKIKHTTKFPTDAIRAVLQQANLTTRDVDAVGYYFGEQFSDRALNAWYSVFSHLPNLSTRQVIQHRLSEDLGWDLADDRVQFHQHHLTHARASFTRSGMDEALVLVMDGRSEDDSISVFRGTGDKLEKLATYNVSQSLGLFYLNAISVVRYGFGDEYKVMGLAPYGDASVYRDIFKSMYTLQDDGQFQLTQGTADLNFAAYTFQESGLPPRRAGEPITQQHKDFAAGLQEMLETVSMHVVRHWKAETGLSNLCFVGGVAHNSSLNGVVLRSDLFDEVFIHPASHDAGAAEGAALETAMNTGSRTAKGPRMRTAALGLPLGTDAEIEATLRTWDEWVDFERSDDVVAAAAERMAAGDVLGWAQGRSEFGPRALGNRSIIADARPSENKTRINAMVKKREAFRPFAPSVNPEDAETYFDLTGTRADHEFMSFVVHVRPERREELGAVTHVDGSARLQIVDPETNTRYYELIKKFGELTGTPVVLNTSFNNDAEPIVETRDDVVTTFLTTGLDLLVMGDYVVRKRDREDRPLENLLLRPRPITRLRTEWTSRHGVEAQVREVYLDLTAGARMAVSAEAFELIRAADGTETVGGLAARLGVTITGELREELFELWRSRMVWLVPGNRG